MVKIRTKKEDAASSYEVFMKKFAIILCVLTVLCLTLGVFLTGCRSVNQLNMLSIGWLDYESYTFDVVEKNGNETQTVGTMTYTFKRLIGDPAKEFVNGKEYSVSSGGYCEYDLIVTAGEYAGSHLYSKVLFDSLFSPIVSYKKLDSSKDELDYEVTADYSGKKTGTITINGEEKSFKKKSGTYDNESLYTIIRGSVFNGDSAYKLSMKVPSNQTADIQTVTVTKTSAEEEITSNLLDDETNKVKFKCSTFTASVPAKYGNGTSTTMSFSNEVYKKDGKSLIKVPVRIVEGNYEYILKAINLA